MKLQDSQKITRLYSRGDDLGPVSTVGGLLNAGANWLRRYVPDDQSVAFQVEGDRRWYEATALFVAEEVDAELVRDLYEEEATDEPASPAGRVGLAGGGPPPEQAPVRDAGADIAIHLFSKPEVDMQEYDPSGPGIREFAAHLAHHLERVARIAEVLEKDGWSLKVVGNSLEARHAQVNSVQEAVGRVQLLGIDPDDITDMAEWDDEGERITPVWAE